jgi:hypothetical protein
MELAKSIFDILKKVGNTWIWGNIILIKLEVYKIIPEGVELISINSENLTKGRGYIDLYTRRGYIAYGFSLESLKSQNSELLKQFLLNLEEYILNKI